MTVENSSNPVALPVCLICHWHHRRVSERTSAMAIALVCPLKVWPSKFAVEAWENHSVIADSCSFLYRRHQLRDLGRFSSLLSSSALFSLFLLSSSATRKLSSASQTLSCIRGARLTIPRGIAYSSHWVHLPLEPSASYPRSKLNAPICSFIRPFHSSILLWTLS